MFSTPVAVSLWKLGKGTRCLCTPVRVFVPLGFSGRALCFRPSERCRVGSYYTSRMVAT